MEFTEHILVPGLEFTVILIQEGVDNSTLQQALLWRPQENYGLVDLAWVH